MIEKDKNKLRLVLDSDIGAKLTLMLKTIRNECPHISINHSSLAGFIVEHFYKTGQFEKCKNQMNRAFFNEKKYIRSVLSSSGDLTEALRKISKNKKK